MHTNHSHKSYTLATHYTEFELERAYIRDLIVDIRCAERDGLPEYANKCRKELEEVWRTRLANVKAWDRVVRMVNSKFNRATLKNSMRVVLDNLS